MVTMVDEFYDRSYQRARDQLNGGISRAFTGLAKAAMDAFTVLNRIEYGAPWLTDRGTAARR